MSISATLSALAIVSGSFWKPSRGPTSRILALLGNSFIAPIQRAETLAQLRQHVIGELIEEASLVGAGRVQDQVLEAELDVRGELLDHLVGVVGNDEPGVGAVDVFVGDPLHLDRVLDPLFLLRRQSQRRPPVAGVVGELAVAVVGDLDLDHLADRARVAPRFRRPLGDFLHQPGVEVGVFAAGRDEAVAGAAGELRRQRPGGGDEDRHRLVGLVVDRRQLGPVVLALEVDPLLVPEAADQLDRLRQPQAPLFAARELAAGDRGLVQRLAGADAEEDAARVERAESAERLGDNRRLVPQGRRQHAGPEHRPLGRAADGAEPDERVGRVAAVVAPGLEVVGDGDDLEAVALGPARELDQLARAELLGGGLVAEPDAHSFLSGGSGGGALR
jgi:hypothetical protein